MVNISKLKSLRVLKNCNQIEFSHHVNICLSSYRLKEQGKVSFTLEEAKRIADFLDMKIEEIFF